MRIKLSLFFIFMIFLSACSIDTYKEVPVPTGSVEFFYEDSKEYVKLFKNKAVDLSPLTEEEQKLIQEYKNKYTRNPRLDDDQFLMQNSLYLLNLDYSTYTREHKKDNDSIRRSNEAIQNFFEILSDFDEDGNLIPKWYEK